MGSRLHDCFFICVTQVFHGLRKCYHISQVEHSLKMLNMFAWFLVGITSDEEVVIYLRYVKPLGKSVKRRNPLLNKIRDESTGEWRCTWFMEQKLCIFGPEQMNVWFCDMFRSLGALSFWGMFFSHEFSISNFEFAKIFRAKCQLSQLGSAFGWATVSTAHDHGSLAEI